MEHLVLSKILTSQLSTWPSLSYSSIGVPMSGKLADNRKLFRFDVADRGRASPVGVPGGLVLLTSRHCNSSFSKESLLLFALSLSKLFLSESRSTESCLKKVQISVSVTGYQNVGG